MKFAEMTWPALARVDRSSTVVVAPIAACEQHSLHLPTYTDSILCGAIADRTEQALPDQVLLLPLLWLGASHHHRPFGATLTLSESTHIAVLVELLESTLRDGFRRVLLLNGHGGNIDTLHVALRKLQPDYPDALLAGAAYWELATPELAKIAVGNRKEVGHACEIETAMVMALRPELVRTAERKDDHQGLPDALRGVYVAYDMSQRTNRGCVGYPESAHPENGARMLDAIVARVVDVCRELATMPITRSRPDAKSTI